MTSLTIIELYLWQLVFGVEFTVRNAFAWFYYCCTNHFTYWKKHNSLSYASIFVKWSPTLHVVGMNETPWVAFFNHYNLQLMNEVPARGAPFLPGI